MGKLDLSAAQDRAPVAPSLPPLVRVRPQHLAALIALETAAFAPLDRFPVRTWRRLLQRPTAQLWAINSRLTPATEGTSGQTEFVAAVAWLLRANSQVARMYSLAVHPQARGQGLARALITASIAVLPPRCMVLSLEVRVDNDVAIALYRSLGFRPSAGLMDYYADGATGMRMRRLRAGPLRPPG